MFTHIALPTRPQPDTIVAIFLLKHFGGSTFVGIQNTTYSILSTLPQGKGDKEYLREGTILLDVGGGIFDHHGKDPQTTASALVATALGISQDKTIQKLLAYAKRDDFYGKGTQSDDPLDKAFGLSGLIAALNKQYPDNITKVVESVLPLIAAHHFQENQRIKELPLDVEELKRIGKFEEITVTQKKNALKVCFVESDNVLLPGFLRATDGGKYDVVVQRRSTGHVNILTKPLKRPDLRIVAEFIRGEEYVVRHGAPMAQTSVLQLSGRNDDVPMWYFDPATNSLQNGGINPSAVEPTQVPWGAYKELVIKGLGAVSQFATQQGIRIVYTACFVDDPNALLAIFQPKHEKVFAHHSTIAYQPKDLSGITVGAKYTIRVIGRVSDEKGDCLLVENPKSVFPIPHITLSCAANVAPFYSNELLKHMNPEKIERFDPIEISVTEGYFDGKQDVVAP